MPFLNARTTTLFAAAAAVALLCLACAGPAKVKAIPAYVGSEGYSAGGSGCLPGDHTDPVTVMFHGTWGGPTNVAKHISGHVGWTANEDDGFTDWGDAYLKVENSSGGYECRINSTQKADAEEGPFSRNHIRLWFIPASGNSSDIKTVGTPHYDHFSACGHAVDEDVHWNYGEGEFWGSGYDMSRAYLTRRFERATSHVVKYDYWGNTAPAHQCTGQEPSSNGGATIISMPFKKDPPRTGRASASATTALLTGTIYGDETPTEWWFGYGPNSSQGASGYPNKSPVQTNSTGLDADVSQAITLTAGTGYYVRMFVRGPEGEVIEGNQVRMLRAMGGEDTTFAGPHPVVQPNGTVDVFYRTPSGQLGHNWYDTGGLGWQQGTLPGAVASDPHPVLQANGTLDVFYRTSTGKLGHNWFDPGSGWFAADLPGEVRGDPFPVVQANGTVDVFYRTPSGKLGHNWYDTGGLGWQQGVLPGDVASVPHAIVQSNGTIDVFYRTPDGKLGHNWFDVGGLGWQQGTLPGDVSSEPHPIVQPNGTIDVFYRTSDGKLGHNWFDVGGLGWQQGNLPGDIASDPYPIVQLNGTLDVFYRTPSGGLGHNWFDTGGSGWQQGTLPGSVTSVPHAVVQPNGTVDVLYPTPSGGLGHNWFDTGGSGWQQGTLPGSVAGVSAPSVANQSASGIGKTTAVLSGTVNPKGGETTYQFEYGKTTAYGSKAPAPASPAGSGTAPEAVSSSLSGLEPNTSYSYRLVAKNANGTTYGPAQSFSTQGPPKITAKAASNVKATEATLRAGVNPNSLATTYQFEYGKTTAYGSKSPASPGAAGSGAAEVEVSQAIGSLTPETTYNYRVVATNSAGTVYGSNVAFTTTAVPPAPTETSISIGQVLNGQPGYVSVSGKVKAGSYPLAGEKVKIRYEKEASAGVWTLMSTVERVLAAAGNYEVPNQPVAAGKWRVGAEFQGGKTLASSVSSKAAFSVGIGYQLIFQHSGKCADVQNFSTQNGALLQQWDCLEPYTHPNQVFQLVPVSGPWYLIRNINSIKCIDVIGASTANGGWLQQWDCNPGANQQLFQLIATEGGWVALQVAHDGKCIDVNSSSLTSGVILQQWDCHWGPNQRVAFQPVA